MEIMQNTVPEMVQEALEMDMARELRVPKREVAADVIFQYAADRSQACLFYLSLYTPRRSGEESLSDFLNSQFSFFPLRDKESRDFFIVHVNQVLLVAEVKAPPAALGRPLRLVLQNGSRFSLHATEPRHAWRSRPIDLLNDEERFISLARQDRTRVHVNKRHIARVEGMG
jgi:hypothetical protein